jgi:hypothetical protein
MNIGRNRLIGAFARQAATHLLEEMPEVENHGRQEKTD